MGEVDELVGRVLDAIESAGVSESTITILTSDNGPMFTTDNAPWITKVHGEWGEVGWALLGAPPSSRFAALTQSLISSPSLPSPASLTPPVLPFSLGFDILDGSGRAIYSRREVYCF